MLKTQQTGIPVCFTVTHLDGIVFARAAMNHNVQFRSVMAFGHAELVEEDKKREVLAAFTDKLAARIVGLCARAERAGMARNKSHSPASSKTWSRSKINDVFAGDEEEGSGHGSLVRVRCRLFVGARGRSSPTRGLAPGIEMPDFAAALSLHTRK